MNTLFQSGMYPPHGVSFSVPVVFNRLVLLRQDRLSGRTVPHYRFVVAIYVSRAFNLNAEHP